MRAHPEPARITWAGRGGGGGAGSRRGGEAAAPPGSPRSSPAIQVRGPLRPSRRWPPPPALPPRPGCQPPRGNLGQGRLEHTHTPCSPTPPQRSSGPPPHTHTHTHEIGGPRRWRRPSPDRHRPQVLFSLSARQVPWLPLHAPARPARLPALPRQRIRRQWNTLSTETVPCPLWVSGRLENLNTSEALTTTLALMKGAGLPEENNPAF
ncbi:uncharacterized protein LOC129686010 [Psammomys obesus]|uniref:uncharacterized protein LOC129686010 n=1 Tax=Psammomys obesus TaxID=48139 RepID=UPI0024533F37|nr:uncharacterized protein LOC129686010 [Psammomys obesus]